jgi:hypothetical protein
MVNLYKCVVYQLSQNKTTVVGPMDPLLWLATAWSTMPRPLHQSIHLSEVFYLPIA